MGGGAQFVAPPRPLRHQRGQTALTLMLISLAGIVGKSFTLEL